MVRHDFYVESDHGIRLFVRELIKGESKASDQKSILLVHGGRVPGLASFDLDVARVRLLGLSISTYRRRQERYMTSILQPS